MEYKSSFTEVTRAIHGEREYQKQRWAEGFEDDGDGPDDRSLTDFMRYTEMELEEVTELLVSDKPEEALHHVRKVAGLCYAAMEVHGAPRREGY